VSSCAPAQVDVQVAPPEQVAEHRQDRDRVADLFGAASSPAGL